MDGQFSDLMADIGTRARVAAAELAFASSERKAAALQAAAAAVWNRRQAILDENVMDLAAADQKGMSDRKSTRLNSSHAVGCALGRPKERIWVDRKSVV